MINRQSLCERVGVVGTHRRTETGVAKLAESFGFLCRKSLRLSLPSLRRSLLTILTPTQALSLLSAVIMTLSASAVCQAVEDHRKTILCSTTQVADFTRQVVGDRCVVKCVMAPGQDPHMYQVTPDDTKLVAEADLCIDNGLNLEGGDWLRVLAEDVGKPIVSCTDNIQPLMIEESGVNHMIEDPHAWFSVVNANQYVRSIYEAVCELDPGNQEEYRARAELYRDQLRALDSWIKRQVNAIPPNQRVLVTSHDAFNYFCDAYGFQSTAPLGWSTQEVGAELTPRRRQEVVDAIQEHQVSAVFVETSVNAETVQEIARDAGVIVGGKLYSDSMGAPGTAGESYVGMMRENVLTLVRALSGS